jgi:hypothetical protein
MPVMPSGHVASASKGTIAIGICVPAPPRISIDNCARATLPSGNRHSAAMARQRRSNGIIERWSTGGTDGAAASRGRGAMRAPKRAQRTPL